MLKTRLSVKGQTGRGANKKVYTSYEANISCEAQKMLKLTNMQTKHCKMWLFFIKVRKIQTVAAIVFWR